jgi:hypothetical protein
MMVEFPDGRPRPIERSILFVDGKPADENTAEPFDRFTWDLTGYIETGQHILHLEIVDRFGLRGMSIATPVNLVVRLPPSNPWRAILRRWPLLAGLAATLAAAFALLILVMSGRLQPGYHWLGNRGAAALRQRLPRRLSLASAASLFRKDSTHTPKDVRHADRAIHSDGSAARLLPGWVNRLHWPQHKLHNKATAYLRRISIADDSSPALISIISDEVTFGRDPNLATVLVNDPSVEALHARLLRNENGAYSLIDQKSVAGTWINYELAPENGAEIKHGDIIHIGRVSLIFQRRDVQEPRKPIIQVQEPEA